MQLLPFQMLVEINVMLRFDWVIGHCEITKLFLMVIVFDEILERFSDNVGLSLLLSMKINKSSLV
jgi:hypothetical protein